MTVYVLYIVSLGRLPPGTVRLHVPHDACLRICWHVQSRRCCRNRMKDLCRVVTEKLWQACGVGPDQGPRLVNPAAQETGRAGDDSRL